jgi:4-amino-4-deoxy-L-arabinose transferase-like glycosyltransferase
VRIRAIEFSLLLSLWFVFGIAINARDLSFFNLQQSGVEALVERRQLSLEGSTAPQLQLHLSYDGDRPLSDAFWHNGRIYAAKQPGQSMLGAIVYSVLRVFGLNYTNNYLLTAALVTFFTSSLITAAAGVAVFGIVRELKKGPLFWPLACAFAFATGTTAFVYSGIAHHDAIASGFLVIAFYLAILIRSRGPRVRGGKLMASGAGLLLGLTITTSMLPFFMVFVVGAYLVLLRRRDVIIPLLFGLAAGLMPLLMFNLVAFGNPFTLSNFVGGYQDTTPHFDLRNFAAKSKFFVWSLSLYVPVFWIGLAGLAFFPRQLRREQVTIFALLIALAIVVLNIDTTGGCQYGPRYLLPAMPYACLGLAGFQYVRASASRPIVFLVVAVAAVVSIFINSAGALHGATHCVLEQYALKTSVTALREGIWKDLPLAPWLLIPLLASLILFGYSVQAHRRTSKLDA